MADTVSRAGGYPSLSDDVQFLKGVGPQMARTLARLDIRTAGDLMRHVPVRHEDRTSFSRISQLRPGEWASVCARVVAADTSTTSQRRIDLTRVLIDDGSGVAQMTFFRQPYLQGRFDRVAKADGQIVVFGQAKSSGYGPIEIDRPEWEEVDESEGGLATGRIVPIYALTEGLLQGRIRRIIAALLQSHSDAIEDFLPPQIRARFELMDSCSAYQQIHFPTTLEHASEARRRLIFEEFMVLEMSLALRKQSRGSVGATRLSLDAAALRAEMARVLPFKLTGAQERAIDDIAADMCADEPMNRLLQGDVGSGKTAVAIGAILLAAQNRRQSALMAPTEILAQQHAIALRSLLEPVGIRVELATGSQRARMRREMLARLAGGESSVAVGTHALIENDVQFARLGLVIVDEQHRFGVLQRQALRVKGEAPHTLVMTATPIPRTLCMTLYGDLDTSVLNELPPGRQPIRTYLRSRNQTDAVYGGVAELIARGRQAYVVCPLVEESEKLEAVAATQLAERVQRDLLPAYRIGLLHGQLPADEKDAVMHRFKAQEIDVLVSTTVIEVGIDVPNAAVIVIEDADRFGLAQLHQLRGRVGRGQHASYCILVSDARTEQARSRLAVMCATQDGFRIAEEDLRLRGPGEYFGTRQSGLPELVFGDVIRDQAILEQAREVAFALASEDPGLVRPEHVGLRTAVERMGARSVAARLA